MVLQRIAEGDSYKNACKFAGISQETFCEWRRTRIEFSELIKKAEETFRLNVQSELEASLWDRAKGITKVEETTVEFLPGPDGKPIIAKQVKKEKTLPPDTGALIFALTNIAPERWKNRQRQDVDITTGGDKVAFNGFNFLPYTPDTNKHDDGNPEDKHQAAAGV